MSTPLSYFEKQNVIRGPIIDTYMGPDANGFDFAKTFPLALAPSFGPQNFQGNAFCC